MKQMFILMSIIQSCSDRKAEKTKSDLNIICLTFYQRYMYQKSAMREQRYVSARQIYTDIGVKENFNFDHGWAQRIYNGAEVETSFSDMIARYPQVVEASITETSSCKGNPNFARKIK